MKILVVDNYDSFTYNLVQLLGSFGHSLTVKRNDSVNEEEIKEISPDKILISPGPGRPEDSWGTLSVLKKFSRHIPTLGVCLGHQAIGFSFGCRIIKAPVMMHGKTSEIVHDGRTIFRGIGQRFKATRYHSLIIEKESISNELEISAQTEDGIIMGIRHKCYPVEGIQFHPESILTTEGKKIINNWLEL
ncbi:MAG: aminodeoxychorismate/anthranilate synthase component II [Ignavibacteria bacterium]|jgi:anthranilate synthase/aminodeoxychorismate synthase-like glutamine amidotransferase|nr:aminodeoxychorismate/anthranilate synthase component II [Ignavibacteria bacterium]MCU7505146.1 aminodeoxychorismate/anthranilate synthase component II [Ignavibacteria bacterium]MCU7518001.1 aminodeoxychorismate/anthranilate synthase component II [Ignavibacteria bacterium]